MLFSIMPQSATKWPLINIRKDDLQMIGAEPITVYHSHESVGVPKFRQIPSFYRSRLAACQKRLGKALKKSIRSHEEIDQNHSESEEDVPVKPKKSKKQTESAPQEPPAVSDSDASSTPIVSEEETDDDWSD